MYRVSCAARCLIGLFRAAPLRTTRGSFDARGSPVTYTVAFTEDTQHHFGALHFAYLLALLVSDHLCRGVPDSFASRDLLVFVDEIAEHITSAMWSGAG